MIFLLRKRKAARNAAAFLEPGEEIRYAVLGTQGGGDTREAATEYLAGTHAGTYQTGGPVHLIALTDRNVYALYVPIWAKIARVSEKHPVGAAQVTVDNSIIRPTVTLNGRSYSLLPWHRNKRDARKLVEAAAAMRGGVAPPQA